MKTPEVIPGTGVALYRGEDSRTLAEALTVRVVDQLRQALTQHGEALLVVSGGRTPEAFLRRLSAADLDWARVHVVPTDERWVAKDDPARNSRMIRQFLLQHRAAEAQLHELVSDGQADPVAAATEASTRLRELPWPAAVVVLGMGEDGHTASLFPGAPELQQGLAKDAPLVIAMTPSSKDTRRLSLSASALSGANATLLLLQGEGKRKALELALAQPQALSERPIRVFFQQPLEVFWCP
ncbi:6-phosphogluconolactonase [Marinobacter sp. AN1]|uniref:6-phosphogluconolactonase n=1 Tax=Marinobacter sp. AN1 TaxID=2886046 RepID=UPI00222F1264|nr:6-phosphogluconolactonase [Marinobacter sp. AN1]UZD64399.1 6-phosphogluconolactonase [Marinobacter sp. AN1]